MRYENELIRSREIQGSSTTDELSTGLAVAASSDTNNPFETLEKFQKKEDV
jgi:hypothetical protein